VLPLSWPTCSNRHFGAWLKQKVIATLHVNRSGSCTSANGGPYCCALTATGDGSDERSNCRANCSTLNGLSGLVAIPDSAFVIDANYISVGPSHRLENTREPVAATITQSNRVEV